MEHDLRSVFEAISRGDISRIEAGKRLGAELTFGDMLLQLREHHLPLPRFKPNPQSPGALLIRALASRGAHAE